MFRLVLVAAMMLNCRAALAEGVEYSAIDMMPACRAYLHRDPINASTPFEVGRCTGVVEGLCYNAIGICVPPGAPLGQIVRVVVKYIDGRPKRQNENFKALALEALRAAWPCKK